MHACQADRLSVTSAPPPPPPRDPAAPRRPRTAAAAIACRRWTWFFLVAEFLLAFAFPWGAMLLWAPTLLCFGASAALARLARPRLDLSDW